jgi:hypothetical protein
MSCNCSLNKTLFLYDIVYDDSIIDVLDISSLIPAYDEDLIGIWRPVFWTKALQTDRTWYKLKDNIDCDENILTPDGLGIRNFITFKSPAFKSWTVQNCELSTDWVVNFTKCKNYTEVILFWYRYYDINRPNDTRLIPGVDIFISDGDYAFADGAPRISSNLIQIAGDIVNSLSQAGVQDATRKGYILASGPQIDRVTEVLSGTDGGNNYDRDEYGLLIPFLRKMSAKRYSDIGSYNFISSKTDLIKKLISKYGISLIVPEGSEGLLISKFETKTGSNIDVKVSGDLYRSSQKASTGYDFSVNVGKLTFSAYKSNEYFIPKGSYLVNSQVQTVDGSSHNINYFKLNNGIIGYSLKDTGTGVFDPGVTSVKFHGLGGINIDTDHKFASSCSNAVSIITDANNNPKAIAINTETRTGPWFVQDYDYGDVIEGGIETPDSTISIKIRPHTNAQYRIYGISVDYLRSESLPECESFIQEEQTKCRCFPLNILHPNASGMSSISNQEVLYTPNASYYRMPSLSFYGGLNETQVQANGAYPPGHPAPGTTLTKSHKPLFPLDGECSYTLVGCGDRRQLEFDFPYQGQIRLDYAGIESSFSVSWNGITENNPGNKYTSVAGTLYIDKTLAEPSKVYVNIGGESKETTPPEWQITISVDQTSYTEATQPRGLSVAARKGFFHPNFGWTFNSNYLNKTAIIPKRSQVDGDISYFYNSYAMYNEEYLPGYNFLYTLNTDRKNIQEAEYIALPTDGGAWYIGKQWKNIRYNPQESLILDQTPFHYINVNHNIGYPYNDFEYVAINSYTIQVMGEDKQRITEYLDDPNFQSQKITLVSKFDKDIYIDANIDAINENIIVIDEFIPNVLKNGYIIKDSSNTSRSVLIYKPYITKNDSINIGKWGHLTYGDAAQEASKFLASDGETGIDRYNNSSLRSGTSRNTYWSWGAPMSFVNGYNRNQTTYFFPTSRLFSRTIDNQRVIHTIGYDNDSINNFQARPAGDRIVSQGSINNYSGYIYLGSYIGNYIIEVSVNDLNQKDTTIKLFHGGTEVASESVFNAQNGKIYLYYPKEDATPVYAQLVAVAKPKRVACGGDTTSLVSITTYSVKINDSILDLQNNTRISFYKHKKNADMVKFRTHAYLFEALNINNKTVSPLYQSDSCLFDNTFDQSPYMDINIFTKNKTYMPIIAESGIVYFEDFLTPKSTAYINNGMEVPYNDNLYWLDVPKFQPWELLSNKGILLSPDKTYKVLKSLQYSCGGQSSACSLEYDYDVCRTSYNLTEGELLETLGFSNEDRPLFNIQTLKANYCAIDYCCEQKETSGAKLACQNAQQAKIIECAEFWKNKSYDIFCSGLCEEDKSTESSGIISIDAEYYILKLADNLSGPNLDKITTTNMVFLPNVTDQRIPCTNTVFNSAGVNFLDNINCSVTKKQCSIVPVDYTIGNQYVSGEFIDLSSLKLGGIVRDTNPLSVILENEKRYRQLLTTNYPNKIFGPLEEYDELAESKYIITHNFHIKSKECIAGSLFQVTVDNVTCDFAAIVKEGYGGVIESSCFKEIPLDTKLPTNKISVTKYECEDEHPCNNDGAACSGESCVDRNWGACEWAPVNWWFPNGPWMFSVKYCHSSASCDQAEEYLKEVFGSNHKYTVDKCYDVSLPEDYCLDTRYCGPKNCAASLLIVPSYPEECHCPDYAELVDTPEHLDGLGHGPKICKYEAIERLVGINECGDTKSIKRCSNGSFWEDEQPEDNGICYFPASCLPAYIGTTQAQINAFEQQCPDGKTEIVGSIYLGDQAISVNAGDPNTYRMLFNKRVEEWSQYAKKECERQSAYLACLAKCQEDLKQCQEAGNNGCEAPNKVCFCSCVEQSTNDYGKLISERTEYWICESYCNISDVISAYDDSPTIPGNNNFGQATKECNSIAPCSNDNSYNLSGYGSWENDPNDICSPGGCDYNACDNMETRTKIVRSVPKCKCGPDPTGLTGAPTEDPVIAVFSSECVEIATEPVADGLEKIDIGSKNISRKIIGTLKKKHNYISTSEKLESLSSRKFTKKQFEIYYKEDDCDNCKPPYETCCNNQCIEAESLCCENKFDIDLDLKFEIYDNLIVVILNNDTSNRLCVYRSSTDQFRCPSISFKSYNDLLFMCDSVSSECTSCYTGSMMQ